MEYIPIHTKVMKPPKDDLTTFLDSSLSDVREDDVIVITSKIVAISEGRCVGAEDFDKDAYVQESAQVIIPRSYWGTALTVTNNMLVSSSGVDQSNSDGYYTLLPEKPFVSAQKIHEYLAKRFNTERIGVIITDSHSVPCRYGAMVGAIAWWGFEPLLNHIGREDLFGRKIQHERSNLVDGIAAGAGVVMGEVDECTPIVIARGVPNLTFTQRDTKDTLFCPPQDDLMRVLYERFL
jgi:coenzyme F420-0:L-glutamate ligase/coenzyme F420-1:gamma-L-glutamate ligase